MRVIIKGREYDISVTAGSNMIHTEYWYGDEAGSPIGGPILGMGIPVEARIKEVLSHTRALMTVPAERTVA